VEGLIDCRARPQVGEVFRVQTRGCAGAEVRSRMVAGMLDAGVDMGNLISDKCNKLLTTVIVRSSQSQGSGSGVGTIPSMSGEARGALYTFVCKRLTVPARCRAKAGRFRPQNTPGWFHPGPT